MTTENTDEGHRVSDQARECPKWACPIRHVQVIEQTGKKWKLVIQLIGGTVTILGMIALCAGFGGGEQRHQLRLAAERTPSVRCWVYPKTARVYDAIVAEFGDDMVACNVRRPSLQSASAQTASTFDEAVKAARAKHPSLFIAHHPDRASRRLSHGGLRQ